MMAVLLATFAIAERVDFIRLGISVNPTPEMLQKLTMTQFFSGWRYPEPAWR
jgi:hypothetical protein